MILRKNSMNSRIDGPGYRTQVWVVTLLIALHFSVVNLFQIDDKSSFQTIKIPVWFRENLLYQLDPQNQTIQPNVESDSTSLDSLLDQSSTHGWEIVTDQWPDTLASDHFNNGSTLFPSSSGAFFFNNDNHHDSKLIRLGFVHSFVEKLQKLNTTVEINFMIWIGSTPKSSAMFSIEVDLPWGKTVNLVERYFPQFERLWMPVQFRIDSSQIDQFRIGILTGYRVVAFRQFYVKYDKLVFSPNVNPNPIETVSVSKLCFPSDLSTGNHTQIDSIIYFANCRDSSCVITFNSSQFSSNHSKQIHIEFEYWNDLAMEDNAKPPTFSINGQQFPVHTKHHNQREWQPDSIIVIPKQSTSDLVNSNSRFRLEFKIEFNNSAQLCPSVAVHIAKVSSDVVECSSTVECSKLIDYSQSTNLPNFDLLSVLANTTSETNSILYSRQSFSQVLLNGSTQNSQNQTTSIDRICIQLEYSIDCWNHSGPISAQCLTHPIYHLTVLYGLGAEEIPAPTDVPLESISLQSSQNHFEKHSLMVCLGDYLRFKSHYYSLAMQFQSHPQGHSTNSVLFFNYRVIPDPRPNIHSNVLHFLVPFEYNRANESIPTPAPSEWQQNWDSNFAQFKKYFAFNSHNIQFSASLDNIPFSSVLNPQQAILSTNWLRYSPNLFHNSQPSYRLRFDPECRCQRYLTVSARICDQMGHCSWCPTQLITETDKQSQLVVDYRFWLNPVPATELFRIEFVFQFYLEAPSTMNTIVAAQFSVLYLGHPCYKLNELDQQQQHAKVPLVPVQHYCKNNGICQADPFQPIELAHCKCPYGYFGTKCAQTDWCQLPTVGQPKLNGEQVCRNKGLQCQQSNTGQSRFVCVCTDQQDSQIIWNSKSERCENRTAQFVKYPKSISQFPIEITDLSSLDPLNSIEYDFDSGDIAQGYDLCFHINWTLWSGLTKDQDLDLSEKPTLFVYYNPTAHSQVILFRHLLLLESTSSQNETISTVQFCLETEFLFPVTNQLNHHSFSVRFHLDTFYMGNLHRMQPETRINIDSIRLELRKTIGEEMRQISTKDYNRRYRDKLVRLSRWNSIRANAILDEKIDNNNNVSVISIERVSILQPLSGLSLISDWFVSNWLVDSVQIGWHSPNQSQSNNNCQLQFQQIRVLYLTRKNELKNVTLDLDGSGKLNVHQSMFETVQFSGLSHLEPGTLFRLVLEAQSFNCSNGLSLANLVKLVEPCSETKQFCLNGGKCRDNYLNGTVNCECNSKYTGNRCQLTNLCSNNDTRSYCQSFATSYDKDSPDSGVNHYDHSCLTISNDSFECHCWQGQLEWDEESMSCKPVYQYQLVQSFLQPPTSLNPNNNSPDSDYLENVVHHNSTTTIRVNVFKWMDRIQYWDTVIDPNSKLPFYLALSNQASLTFDLSQLPTDNTDLCLWIDYYTHSEGSWIGIGPAGLQSHSLLWTKNKERKSNVCLKTYIALNQHKSRIQFGAKLNQSIGESFVGFRVLNQTLLTTNHHKQTVDYVPVDSDQDDFQQYWPIQFPSGVWRLESKSRIKFTIKDNDFSTNNELNQYNLASVWIRSNHHQLNYQHRLQFSISDDSSNDSFCGWILRPVVYDESMNDISEKTIEDFQNQIFGDSNLNARNKSNNVLIHIRLSSEVELYRIGFQVLTLSSLSNTTDHNIEFSLFDVNVDDYCIDDQFTPVNCMSHGRCHSSPTSSQRYHCSCQLGYTGPNCEDVDYCAIIDNDTGKSGDQICREYSQPLKCLNQINGFSCQCERDFYWDNNSKRCRSISPCLTNQNRCNETSEICSEQFNGDRGQYEPVCQCNRAQGYVPNVKTNKCQLRNPCNLDTDTQTKQLQSKPAKCGSNSQCFAPFIGSNDTENFACYCKDGFELKLDPSTNTYHCQSSVCSSPFGSNGCEQRCDPLSMDHQSGPGYRCSCFTGYTQVNQTGCQPNGHIPCQQSCFAIGSYCNFDTKQCSCSRPNFVYVANYSGPGTFDVCIPKEGVKLWECPYGNYTISKETGQIWCYCDGQIYIDNGIDPTCELLTSCSIDGDGYNECGHQKALCLLDTNSLAGYRCQCPPGQHLFTNNGTNSELTCQDHCEDPVIQAECHNRHNAQCNPLALINSIKHYRFDPNTFDDWEELCQCPQGFRKHLEQNRTKFNCQLSSTVYLTNLSILKLSYQNSFEYRKFFNLKQIFFNDYLQKEKEEDLSKSSTFHLLSKLSTNHFNQFIQQFESLKNDSLQKISKHLEKVAMLQIRSIVDSRLDNLITHSLPLLTHPLITVDRIRTVWCEDKHLQSYINCTVEVIVVGTDEPNSDKVRIQFRERVSHLIEKWLVERCHPYRVEERAGLRTVRSSNQQTPTSTSNVCVILDENDRNVQKINDNFFDQPLLIVDQNSIKRQPELLPLFKPCSVYQDRCPQYSYCQNHPLDSGFGCHCLNSSVLMENNPGIVDQFGQPNTTCRLQICSPFCPKSRYRTGFCSHSEPTTSNGQLFTTVNCSCNADLAISIAYNANVSFVDIGDDRLSRPDYFVELENICVDKDRYFCHFQCGHGKCQSDKPPCKCDSGWTGASCDQKDGWDTKLRWLFIAILLAVGLTLLSFLLFLTVCLRARHKRRMAKKDQDDDNNYGGFDENDDRVLEFYPVNKPDRSIRMVHYRTNSITTGNNNNTNHHTVNRTDAVSETITKAKTTTNIIPTIKPRIKLVAPSKASNQVQESNEHYEDPSLYLPSTSKQSNRSINHTGQISLSAREFATSTFTPTSVAEDSSQHQMNVVELSEMSTSSTSSSECSTSSMSTFSSAAESIPPKANNNKLAKSISTPVRKKSSRSTSNQKSNQTNFTVNPAIADIIRTLSNESTNDSSDSANQKKSGPSGHRQTHNLQQLLPTTNQSGQLQFRPSRQSKEDKP